MFDLDTFTYAGETALPFSFEATGSLVRWGVDGFAYRLGQSRIVFVRSSRMPVGLAVDLGVSQQFSPAGPGQQSPAELVCRVENPGPDTAQGVRLELTLEGLQELVEVSSTGQVTTNGIGQIICDFGVQLNGTTNSIALRFVPHADVAVVSTATVSAHSPDPVPGNNTAIRVLAWPDASDTTVVSTLSLPVTDLAADTGGHGLYLGIDRKVPNWGNSVVRLESETGQFTRSPQLGMNLGRLVLSADATTLYAATEGKLHKLDARSLTKLAEFPLRDGDNAFTVAVAPEDPGLVAVWHESGPDNWGAIQTRGLGVYAEGSLVGEVAPNFQARLLSFTAADRLLSHSFQGDLFLDEFTVTRAGITPVSTRQEPYLFNGSWVFTPPEPRLQAGRIFSGRGWVYDTGSSRLMGTFAVPGTEGWPRTSTGIPLVAPDGDNGRVYFIKNSEPGVMLHAFDDNRFRLLGSAPIPQLASTPRNLVRWGTNGLAFRDHEGLLFLVRSPLIPSGPEADLAVGLSGGSNPGRVGESGSYEVTVTNLGPAALPTAQVTLTANLPGTFAALVPEAGVVVPADGQWRWETGRLEAGAVARLTWRFTPEAGSLLQLQAQASASARDRNPVNDAAIHWELVQPLVADRGTVSLPLAAREAVSDGEQVFVSLHAGAGVAGNSVLRIHPASGRISPPLFIGSGPGAMEFSPDGSRLWVALEGASSVREVNLADWTVRSSCLLPNGLHADQIGFTSGTPERLVANLLIGEVNRGLAAFEAGNQLPALVEGLSGFVFSDTTGELFGYDREHSGVPLTRLQVSADGLTPDATLPLRVSQAHVTGTALGGLLYLGSGQVLDPVAQTESRRYPVAPWTRQGLPMADMGQVVFLNLSLTGWRLRGFELETAVPVGVRELPDFGDAGRMVRWGNHGLAYPTAADRLVIVESPFVPGPRSADVAIEGVQMPPTALRGEPFPLTIAVTNRSDVNADNVIVICDLNFQGFVQDVAVSAGAARTTAPGIRWTAGSLAAHQGAQLTLRLTPTNGVALTGQVTVSSASPDSQPANNATLFSLGVQPAGTEVITTYSLAAKDLIADHAREVLWVAVASSAFGPALVPLNPFTGVTETALGLASEPGRLALDAGQTHLHVLQPDAGGILRVNLEQDAASQFTSLGFDPVFGFHKPTDLAVAPLSPLRLAVSYHGGDFDQAGYVALIQDGAIRPLIGQDPFNRADLVAYDPQGDLVYSATTSGGWLDRYAVSNQGLKFLEGDPGRVRGLNPDLKLVGDRLYDSSGAILDARLRQVITNLGNTMTATAVEPSLADGRIYYATVSPLAIRALSLTNYSLLGEIPLVGLAGQAVSLVRWGINGLALHTSAGEVVLVRTTLVPVVPGSDADADGLPDTWESASGLNPHASLDAAWDGDGDGQSALDEFLAGTNPADPASVLRFRHVTWGPESLEFRFQSVPGKRYQVETRAMLEAAEWMPLEEPFVGQAEETVFRLGIDQAASGRFFRLRVVP